MSDLVPARFRRPGVFAAAVLVIAAGWFVYSPAFHGRFLWDDRADIVENPLLRDVSGLWKIWSQPTLLFDFYPIKYSIQWLQWQLWGDQTRGYHLTNVALHLLSAFLFWRVLRQLGLRHGWLGALLFAVHPLAIESVAWIAELKNTLSLPLLLLAFGSFIEFTEHGRRADYVRSVLWFVVTLLCKTSVVGLPVVLLLFLWWRRGRLDRREALLTIPFFALSLIFGVITLWFQAHRGIAEETFEIGGPLVRLGLTGTTYGFYLWKCLWPTSLIPIYPQWSINPPGVLPLLLWSGALGALVWMWRSRITWGRHALLATGWFAVYLAPCVGLVTISYMRFSWVMDHMAYVSLLSIIALEVAVIERFSANIGRALLVVGLVHCAWLASIARTHAAIFVDEESLWTHTLRFNPSAWMAHNNLGAILEGRGLRAEARAQYEEALRLRPSYADPLKNLGDLSRDEGHLDEARAYYERAIALRPTFSEAHTNYGELLRTAGDAAGALDHLRKALMHDPENPEAHHSLALLLRDDGQPKEAINHFGFALLFRPDFPEAHVNLASVLRQVGRTDEAVAHLTAALKLKPRSPEVRFNLGNALQSLGRHADAIVSYGQAIQLKPDLAPAHYNLAISLLHLGRTDEARTHHDQARRLDPTLPEIKF